MNTEELKKQILDKVSLLNNEEVLLSLNNLLNMSDSNLANFLKLANEKLQDEEFSETEDFNGYIKEWVKSM
jgi:uncharacterized protein YehS (DUF1456 family)